jgi:hypothetical protein
MAAKTALSVDVRERLWPLFIAMLSLPLAGCGG